MSLAWYNCDTNPPTSCGVYLVWCEGDWNFPIPCEYNPNSQLDKWCPVTIDGGMEFGFESLGCERTSGKALWWSEFSKPKEMNNNGMA